MMCVLAALGLLAMDGVQVSAGDVTTLKAARRVAIEALGQLRPPMDFKLHDKETIEKSYGWIFFYSPKGKGDSHAYGLKAIGAGPLVVERVDGVWQFLGSTVPPEVAIKNYEKRLGLDEESQRRSRKP
jgi:hypothetical protein